MILVGSNYVNKVTSSVMKISNLCTFQITVTVVLLNVDTSNQAMLTLQPYVKNGHGWPRTVLDTSKKYCEICQNSCNGYL